MTPDPARRRKQLIILGVVILLTLILYPQLKDFGAEIVRAFT
jgi:hypothetical protein